MIKKLLFAFVLLASIVFIVFHAEAKNEPAPVTIDGLKVAVWLPKETKEAPVIIFSHGFHGCATQSVFLMEALAKAGYAVFAPNHKDAICYGGLSRWLSFPQISFHKPEKWSDTTYADRKADIIKLLDTLPSDPRYKNLDWKHVGLAGHSLGGYTVLGVAGAWPSWQDKRIKAVLALSPYSTPYSGQHTLAGIHVPVMYQGGTRDYFITPEVKKNGGVYDQTPMPKYYIDLKGAGHLDWADIFSGYHDIINRYSVAFFDTALKAKPFPEVLTKKSDQVDEIRIDTGK